MIYNPAILRATVTCPKLLLTTKIYLNSSTSLLPTRCIMPQPKHFHIGKHLHSLCLHKHNNDSHTLSALGFSTEMSGLPPTCSVGMANIPSFAQREGVGPHCSMRIKSQRLLPQTKMLYLSWISEDYCVFLLINKNNPFAIFF